MEVCHADGSFYLLENLCVTDAKSLKKNPS